METAEALKKTHAKAKSLFTKSKKNLIRAIDNKSDVEIVQGRLEELKKAYYAAQEKHEEYMTSLNIDKNADNYEEEEAWITGIDNVFDETEQTTVTYVRNNKVTENTNERPAGVEQPDNKEKQYLSMHKCEEILFNTLHDSFASKIKLQMEADEPILDVIKEELSDLKRQSEACKQANHKYISSLPEASNEVIQWTKSFQDKVTKLTTEFSKLMQKKLDAKETGIPQEKLRNPTFSGNIREYPRFKGEFERHVKPSYKNNLHKTAFALKSCLSGEPLDLIRNVDDDYNEMIKRLDDKYGDTQRFTDAIMNEVKSLTAVSSRDDQGFIHLVNLVESGYRDLERLNLQSEMSNSTAISIIKDKLPGEIRRFWALEVNKSSSSEGNDKFKKLLNFLL